MRVVDHEGNVRWYKDETDILHREDGPAIEYINGDKYWYLNGKYHREDGPAIEHTNGDKYWYLNGYNISEEEHQKRVSPVYRLQLIQEELRSILHKTSTDNAHVHLRGQLTEAISRVGSAIAWTK